MPIPEPISDASGMIATQPIAVELARDDRIVGRVDHHLEAVPHQGLRGADRLAHVREQRMRVAQHLELDERVAVEELARELQRAHRIVGGVAARGVREIRELRRRQRVEQRRRVRVLADVGASDRDGDDLRARRDDRLARLARNRGTCRCRRAGASGRRGPRSAAGRRAWLLRACAEHSCRRLRQPPPTAPTISIRSPLASSVAA